MNIQAGNYVRTIEADNHNGKIVPVGWVGQVLKVKRDGFQQPILEVLWTMDSSVSLIRPAKVELA